jgi:hypothetical protein
MAEVADRVHDGKLFFKCSGRMVEGMADKLTVGCKQIMQRSRIPHAFLLEKSYTWNAAYTFAMMSPY